MLNIDNHQGNANQNHSGIPIASEDVGKSEPLGSIGGNINCLATVENTWRFLKKLKIEPPHNPAIPLLGVYLKKNTKTLIQKNTCPPTFRVALFTIAKILK